MGPELVKATMAMLDTVDTVHSASKTNIQAPMESAPVGRGRSDRLWMKRR